MNSSMYFQVASIFYAILLVVVYFSKQRLNTLENKIYKALIVINLFSLVTDILSIITITHMDVIPITNYIVTRMYLAFALLWIFVFTLYIVVIASNMGQSKNGPNILQKLNYVFLVAYIVYLLLLFILPLNCANTATGIYTFGPGAYLSYGLSGLLILVELIAVIIHIKNLKIIKILPMLLFFTFGILSIVIQISNPSILLISYMDTFITFLMYFTIENPDMALIAQLNLAKEQADKANQAKSDFLSNMSHEIRTPLNAIVGFGQALSEEDLPPQAMSEVKDIMMASDNLLEIVNGILDISKIESGKLEIINKDYSFKKIFDEVVTLAKGRLGEKPLEFRVAYDESIPPVLFGDYSRIKEIMINLLTNAIKYTHEGYIELKVSSVIKDDICRIIISVEDSGIGIKQENINKLFTKFERLGVEEHATIEGTGLGLAITKKLLDLMNGQIVVQSVYGKGSRFTVAIDQKISVGHKLEDTASLDLTELETMDFSSKKVLVVDDNVINLKVAHRLLQEYKVQITEVQSGQAAIDLINAGNTYDLILMDDMMPKTSGVQTLQKLKTIPGFQMKVVALTANAITGMREKYLADGFDEYLAKPISKKELAKIIKKMLGN